MHEDHAPSSDPGHPSSAKRPEITLFGKRMEMEPGKGSRWQAPPGYDSTGERRAFLLLAGVFLLALAGLLAWVGLSHSRRAAVPAQSPAQAAPAPATPAPQAAAPSAPPAPVHTRAAQSAEAAPSTRAETNPAASAPAEKARPPAQARETAARHAPAKGPARAKARPRAPVRKTARAAPLPRRLPADNEYIQRLREQKKQYERDKALGKYQEFPR